MQVKIFLHIGLLILIASSAACQRSFASFDRSGSNRISTSSSPAAPRAIVDKEYEEYRQQVLKRFQDKDYSWIDQEAHRLRLKKERLPGGYWKLRALYAAIENPAAGQNASDGDWEDLLQRLNAWATANPKSVTARVALGMGWKDYAWKARGDGYADSVSQAAWDAFEKRLGKAQQALTEAVSLEERCPYWYFTALWVGIGQQRDRNTLERIFQAGVQLEPTFYYLYQVKAMYLLPRWGGAEGEWERFADDSALKIGGHEGDIVFFTIYSQMLSTHGMQLMNNHQQAVPKLLAGFRSIEKLYGSSRHRLNEACFFSVFGPDGEAANELFSKVGDDYDEGVWRSKQSFEVFRQGTQQRAQAAKAQLRNSGAPQSAPPKN